MENATLNKTKIENDNNNNINSNSNSNNNNNNNNNNKDTNHHKSVWFFPKKLREILSNKKLYQTETKSFI